MYCLPMWTWSSTRKIVSEIYANYQSVLGGDMTPQEAMDAVQSLAETLPWVGVPQGEA